MPKGTITALRAQEHDSQRVSVFVDDQFALGISLNTLARAGLYVGQQLDAATLSSLEAAESADKAYQAALRFLQARPRSVAEVRARLERKALAPQAIDSAIARLHEHGLLDDRAFARFWVENRNTNRPRGPQALRSELHARGIARDLIDTVLQDEELMGDEHARALALAQAALPRYASVTDWPTFQRRLGGYVQRRGFGYDIVRSVVEQLWRAHTTPDTQEQSEEPGA